MNIHKKAFSTVFILMLSCYSLACLAQFSDTRFINYTTTDLLSDNKVTSLTQDRLGYMWIGTREGLCRFDGLNSKKYYSEVDKESLPSDEILKLKWIDSNKLAIITRLGLNILDVQTMQQRNLVIPADSLKHVNRVNNMRDLLTDRSGNYYITTRTGFYHINDRKEIVFRYDDYSFKQIENSSSGFGIFMGWLDDDHIIIEGQKGFYCYNIRKRIFSKIPGGHSMFLIFAQLNKLKGQECTIRQPWPGCFLLFMNYSDTAIYVDEKKKLVRYSRLPISPIVKEISWNSELYAMKDSSLYITGKSSGFLKFVIDKLNGSLKFDTTKYFNDHVCNAIFFDEHGRTWVGTNRGLWAERKNQLFLQFGKLPDSITMVNPGISTQQVTGDDAYVYAGSSLSGGLHVFKKSDLSFKKTCFFNLPAKAHKTIHTVLRTGDDTILCGAAGGLYWYNTHTETGGHISLPGWDMAHEWIANLYIDNNKNIWITSNTPNGCYLLKRGSNMPVWLEFEQQLVRNIKIIWRMDEDADGNIWMAGNGLARFNIKKGMFDLCVDSFPALRWSHKEVSSLACDKKGTVWIGNAANGLISFSPRTMTFATFTTEDGLPDNTVVALKEVDGVLWIACRNGLAKMNLTTRQISNIVSREELLLGKVNGNRLFYDSIDQMIYMGVGPGMIRFKSNQYDGTYEAPHLLVENLVLGNDSVRWNPSGRITTSWQKRNVTILFNAINFNDATDQRYAYRVRHGKDTAWIGLDDQRRVAIDNLTQGSYNIDIKVFSINNRWPPCMISLVIVVKAPFWKTWWFLSLCSLVAVSIMYALLRYRINQLKKMIIVREKLSQDLHDEVGATLSGIAMYSHLTVQQINANEVAEVKKSLGVIQQSATEMVTRLSDIVWSVNPKHDSLHTLVEKLEEYATEIAIAKKIKLDVNIPAGGIVDLKLSMEIRKGIYMICKEAINNAVKYSGASSLELAVNVSDQSLEFSVRDNGKGFDLNNVKKGNGLENMQKRTAAIGGQLILQPKLNEGTYVTLQCKITR